MNTAERPANAGQNNYVANPVVDTDPNRLRQDTARKSADVLSQLKKLGREGVQRPAENNPHLDTFLSRHAKPEITMSGDTDFFVRLDRRYSFKPGVRLSPFRSFAEPWPLPQEYRSNAENVFQLNPISFKIKILSRTSDILQEAVKRYTEVILKHSLEEPYSFLNNFHESFEKYNTDDPKKYEKVQPLPSLSVFVAGSDTGYPRLDYNETCKYQTIFCHVFCVMFI